MQLLNHETKNRKKDVNPVAVGLTGVVIGAAAGAAAIALSDEKNRKMATQKAKSLKNDLQKWSTKTIQDIQKKGQAMQTSSKQRLEESKTDVTREVKERLDEEPMK